MLAKISFLSKTALVGLLGLVWLLSPGTAAAGDKDLIENFWRGYYGNITLPKDPSVFSWERLAKGQPDECSRGIGYYPANIASFNSFYPGDMTDSQIDACLGQGEGRKPKVNQAYVWGLAKEGKNLWFGTIANTLCLVLYNLGFGLPPMEVDDDWVCEGGPSAAFDVRPPRIFVYDTKEKKLEELTEKVLDTDDANRLRSTIGLRSAGAMGGVAFLGGISPSGVNIFAFNARTKAYLGSRNYNGLNNIRQWREMKKQLYVGVGKPGGGEIWRWVGSLSDPFQFETVGDLEADPAYLAEHKNRIFVSTWGVPGSPFGAALYMSPPFGPDQRLGPEDAAGWTIEWKISDYEVEPAAFHVGGALASYGAYLYWGTMTIPGVGLLGMDTLYPGCSLDAAGTAAAFLGTYRPIHIFRGKDFGKKNPPRIELLYGSSYLPKFDGGSCSWGIVRNGMGQAPRFGLAGMNNFFNNYTWWMERYRGRLFVGTMDWLYLGGAFARQFGVEIPERIIRLASHFSGADLFSFVSLDLPALPVSLNGLGNKLNYGIRTMVADDFLYLGTANPMNLATDPDDEKPEGGWELYRLRIEDDPYYPGVPD